MAEDKLRLLKSLKLLSAIPDDQLAKLGDFLKPETFQDGQVIFEEGSKGDSLCFITAGHVRIAKKLRAQEEGKTELKELAVLAPGDCFGEMALIEEVSRSADAIAMGETVMLRLGRDDLNKWLKEHPTLAIGFFAQLVQVLSERLRHSSNEMTLLFDLSQLLLENFPNAKVLLDKVMTRIMQYLEGDWCAGAYVYNIFNEEHDLVDSEGDYDGVKDSLKIDLKPEHSAWADDSTYQVVFPGKERAMGFIVFHRAKPLDGEEKNEFTRTMTTTARLISQALENLEFRTEEDLRRRLQKNVQASGHAY